MKLLLSYQNAAAATIRLLEKSGYDLDPQKVIDELDKHPYYPSILAISDVLSNFNIDNDAYSITPDDLAAIPCPFIAHTHLNNGDFIVVNRLDGEHAYVSSDKWTNRRLGLAELKTMFSGTVLTVEKSGSSSNVEAKRRLGLYRTPALLAGLVLIFFAALITQTNFTQQLNWGSVLSAIFKTMGLTMAVLLLIQSIDSNNPLVQKLCKGTDQANCNTILTSKAAKAFAGLSWSEVGFFYFAGTWLLLIFGGGGVLNWRALFILNLLCLPYTIYSIYYQAIVARQWCIMCCTVQAVLWLDFLTMLAFDQKKLLFAPFPPFYLADLVRIGIFLLLPALLWLLVKSYLLEMKQIPAIKEQLRKFKYNAELFNVMLTNQPKYTLPDENWSIVLGNVHAGNIITMVSNPYCPPCSKMHQALDEWLNKDGDLQARIVFTANNTETDIKTPVARHLMALNDLPDKTIVRQALHDWYDKKQKNYQEWAKAYPVQLHEKQYYKLDEQHAWCQRTEVTATPTMLLNGYRLPTLYQLSDLKYMLA